MDGARYCPYPDYTWFGIWRSMFPHEPSLHVHCRQINHTIFYAHHASAEVRWIRRGQEDQFVVPEHAVHFAPADGEEHVRIARVRRVHRFFTLLIPALHLEEIASAEGCKPPGEFRVLLGIHDAVLQRCIIRLAGSSDTSDACSALRTSEAARLLALRLAELTGRGRPDWSCDTSVFDRRTLASLVDYIDEHLRSAPPLGELALRVGLSPSHFARKFRQSTGLSVQRFINRRRVNKSLGMLRADASSLTDVAIDLGFSSQSHFTRLFSSLTGFTPAKYRKQFRTTARLADRRL